MSAVGSAGTSEVRRHVPLGGGTVIYAAHWHAFPAVLRGFAGAPPSERVGVAVAGVRGRGNNLLGTFAGIEEVDVRYIVDVDASVLHERRGEIVKETRHRPQAIADFRRALDDHGVDALVLGTPDHWHAIPTILACQAGKDVYTEKPDGHNILESHTMVAAAKRHQRVVQLGTQSRSAAPHLETIASCPLAHEVAYPACCRAVPSPPMKINLGRRLGTLKTTWAEKHKFRLKMRSFRDLLQ